MPLINFYGYCLLLSVLLAPCNKEEVIKEKVFPRAKNIVFSEGNIVGSPQHPNLTEVSGIAISRNNPDLIWAHNDSRHPPEIYLMNFSGEHIGKVLLKNASNKDWEDMAIGPGPVAEIKYIYIGDIGDNRARQDVKTIYRFPEPDVESLKAPFDITIKKYDQITFQFPDGNRDAETLMIDPLTKSIYIISKREAMVRIYKAEFPQSLKDLITLKKVGNLDLSNVVAGDISADGSEILIKTYTDVYYWKRRGSELIEETLKKNPKRLRYKPEPQGEAIAWKPNGNGYFTLSEKAGSEMPSIYFYQRK
jgi:hypothetical protein